VVHSLLKLWKLTVCPWILSILSQEILSSISPSNSTILRQLCNVPVGRWDLQQAGFRTIPGCPCPTETLRLYQKDKPSFGEGSEPAQVAVVQNSLNQSSAKLQDIRSICISGCAWTIFSRGHLCPPLQYAIDPRLDLWNRLRPSPVSSGSTVWDVSVFDWCADWVVRELGNLMKLTTL